MIRTGLGLAVVMVCLASLCGSCPAAVAVDCPGTLQAWRSDHSMRQYLNDYSCDCSNGNSRQPVCTKRGGGGSSRPPSYGGGKQSSKNDLNRQIAQTLVS